MKQELTVNALTENLSQVISFVEQFLEYCHCSEKVILQTDMAVEEIFVNIACYAYGSDTGSATICVEYIDFPPSVVITFTDYGIPYNPLTKSDPDTTLSAEERQIGGLGIFIVKKIMDEVLYEYHDNKNCLTIRKAL